MTELTATPPEFFLGAFSPHTQTSFAKPFHRNFYIALISPPNLYYFNYIITANLCQYKIMRNCSDK